MAKEEDLAEFGKVIIRTRAMFALDRHAPIASRLIVFDDYSGLISHCDLSAFPRTGCHVTPRQQCGGKIDSRKIHAVEAGLPKDRRLHVCTREIGAANISTAKIRGPEIRTT